MTPDNKNWHSDIEAPLNVGSADDLDWTDKADVVVIGLGGAGVSASLQAIENGLSVIALDRFEGGGATKASGGVIYAGGGTSTQKEADVEDTAENMFNYLKLETEGIVSDATLRDFCEQSAPTIEWLKEHKVDLRGTLWPHKTSYPAPKYFLYHSDNSLVPSYKKHAAPAARGHRGYVPIKQGAKATNLGGSIFDPLKASAEAKGLRVLSYTEVRQLVTNAVGDVIGVKALQFEKAETLENYKTLRAKANKLFAMFPPIIPGSKFFFKKAMGHLKKAEELASSRTEIFIRADKGVVLSAGGFVFNSKMMAHYAPKYTAAYPLGTDGDNGAGIRLGQSVGGAAENMNRITAWRFINPPLSFARGMIVNENGQRFINEMVYGATLGVEMTENHNGRAWMILDRKLIKQALEDVKGDKALAFQRALAKLNAYFGAKKAKSISELAAIIKVDGDNLETQLSEYNKMARGEIKDPFEKTQDDLAQLDEGSLVAIDISLSAKLFPCPTLTLGGLKVNESTGCVLDEGGEEIIGLYAAGRNAIGVASWSYVSGLSIADCVYSGRRAANSLSA
ncbi:FAD-binding protein [Hellea balneolensis]|uniref:FAD-binding protein n=1 Tax=Hellea balneolensis TaxID=287478 RepID=UPI0003FF2FD0|nr:FAD-binding protein [Hellea balneolensis]